MGRMSEIIRKRRMLRQAAGFRQQRMLRVLKLLRILGR